jgi:hypothetical protein
MKNYTIKATAWVSEDGSFSGSNYLLTFDPSELTAEQWETLADLNDSERIRYAKAVMDGESLTEWEL